MTAYLVRRLLMLLPTVVIILFLTVLMVRLIPGDTIDVMLQSNTSRGADRVTDRKLLEQRMGLDKPIPVQFAKYVVGVTHLDFGTSLWTRRPVSTSLRETLPVTLELSALSLIVAGVVGVGLGVFSAIRRGRVEDYVLRSVAILGLSVPGFAIGTLIVVLPAVYFSWVPPYGYTIFTQDPVGNITHLILPACILGLAIAAGLMRFTRTMMLEVLRQDYVRTARSKGLNGFTVVSRHAVKNSLIPVITVLGLQVAAALGGSVIMEQIFSLPGLGQLLITSINQRDYPIVQGVTVLVGLWVASINLLIDLSYGLLDPRVRVGRGAAG